MARYDGPIVDAHHHLWRFAPSAYPWLAQAPALARSFGPDDYRAAAQGWNVAASVWVEALAADPLAEAEAAAELHRGNPDLCNAAVAHAPLDAPDLEARLDRLAMPTLRGIRDIVAPRFARRPDLLASPAFEAGLHALAARGLSFDLLLEPDRLPAALALARRVPTLLFILEHAGSPDFSGAAGTALWRRHMQALARAENVAVKISALHCRMPGWTDARLAPHILELIDWFGVHRLAFASDFPAHDRTCPLDDAFRTFSHAVAGLPGPEQRALFHDTARGLYRL